MKRLTIMSVATLIASLFCFVLFIFFLLFIELQDNHDKWHAGLILTASTGVRLKGSNDIDDIDELIKANRNQVEDIVNEISNTFTGESHV